MTHSKHYARNTIAIKKRVVRDALIGKFGFVEVAGTKHDAVALFVEGRKVVMTRFSRGHSEIADSILVKMANQIGVNLSVFKEMIGCTIGREEYLRQLRQTYPTRFEQNN